MVDMIAVKQKCKIGGEMKHVFAVWNVLTNVTHNQNNPSNACPFANLIWLRFSCVCIWNYFSRKYFRRQNDEKDETRKKKKFTCTAWNLKAATEFWENDTIHGISMLF